MSKNENPIEMFGRICSSIANTMDEEGLSTEDALNAVRRMLKPVSKTKEVLDGISRLESASTEVELWRMLVQEADRALHLNENPWPTSLFD